MDNLNLLCVSCGSEPKVPICEDCGSNRVVLLHLAKALYTEMISRANWLVPEIKVEYLS